MSGITAVDYVVETPEEQRRREQRTEWERYAARRAELSALRGEADSYRAVFGSDVARIPAIPRVKSGSAPARIAAATALIEEIIATHGVLLRESVAVAARQEALRDVAAAVPVVDGARDERVRSTRSDRKSTVEDEREAELRARSEHVRRKLMARAAEQSARLPAQASDEVRAACRQAVVELSTTPSEARARLILIDLTHRVQVEVDARLAARETGIALEALAVRLEAVAPADSAELRKEIAALVASRAGAVPRGLPDRVTAVVDGADRARRRKMVVAALRLSLDELDYQVAEGFETVLAERGSAFANLPDKPGYGLKVLLDTRDDSIRTQVVRSERLRADSTRDAEAEQAFCDRYPTLLTRLRRHGVVSAEPVRRPAGGGPVTPVAENLLPESQSHENRTSTAQAKEMPT